METRSTFYRRNGKRILDVIVSAAAIIVLAPVLCTVALLVRVFLGAPILYRQTRSGKGQRPFTIWKFRTMTDERDADGELLSDTIRLTRLGRFLRATSLDELPELFNVLKGDMSLVGPRPLLPRYDAWYLSHEMARFDVLPGITGWAQINGRNASSWEERFQRDVEYVNAYGFWMDVKILFLTIGKVLWRENVHVNTDLVLISLDDERRGKLADNANSTPPGAAAPKIAGRACYAPVAQDSR